jgi:hypothetical protein
LNSKKKKLTDIGFMVFPGLKERYFSMDLDWRSMFVEHQSTSENKDRLDCIAAQEQN